MLSHVHLFATLMDDSPPDSSVHGIFQARILEWLPFPTPGDLSNPGIEPTSPLSPAFVGGFFTTTPGKRHLGNLKDNSKQIMELNVKH